MKNTILELEQRLKEETEKELLINLNNQLEKVKQEYEGKCFGSNLFHRMHKSRYFNAVYYEKFFIKNNEAYVIEWTLSGQRYPSFYKTSTPTYTMNTYIHERKISEDNYSFSYNTFSGFSFYRKPISVGEFMSLWKAAKECYFIIKDVFNSKPELEIEDIRQGDYSNEQTIDRIITELKLDIIDFKQYPKMFWIFEYKTLPMLQNGRWIPRIYAKQLLEYVIKDYEKDNISIWSTSRSIDYNNERIKTIEEFIATELK
jgi:hypothetical protein